VMPMSKQDIHRGVIIQLYCRTSLGITGAKKIMLCSGRYRAVAERYGRGSVDVERDGWVSDVV
jgi:hypothetical protein